MQKGMNEKANTEQSHYIFNSNLIAQWPYEILLFYFPIFITAFAMINYYCLYGNIKKNILSYHQSINISIAEMTESLMNMGAIMP